MLLAGDDFDDTPLTATFNTGDTSVTVMIPVVDDTVVDEEDEEFSITLSVIPAAGVRIELGDVSTARGVIEDTSKDNVYISIVTVICNSVYVAKPQIIAHPLNRLVEVNNDSTNVQFTCMAEGAISYYWERRGDNSIPSGASRIKANTLTLVSLTPLDEGQYRCVAKNKHGTNFSNYANLTINGM